jgi:HKD family nuclease
MWRRVAQWWWLFTNATFHLGRLAMSEEIRYIFDNWEDELMQMAHDAIECSIASAYINAEGVEFLSKLAKRLASLTTSNSGVKIRVVLSNQFAPNKEERISVLRRISSLPGVEVRIYCGDELQHRKNYIFRTNNEIKVMVGSVNITSAGLFRNLEIASLSTHRTGAPEIEELMSRFDSLWHESESLNNFLEMEDTMQKEPLFTIGDNVRYVSTGRIGTVNKVIPGTRGHSYRVTIDGQIRTIAERFLEHFEDSEEDIVEDFMKGPLGTSTDFKIFQTWFRLAKPIEGNLYSYLGSKTQFNPYQFKPLLRFVSSNSEERLFIADEVGVGKTIETGIILTELIGRGRLDQRTPILIVCPYSLGPKWRKEMKERFNLDFHLHDGKSLKYMLDATLKDGVFPQKYCFSIAPLQLIRGEEYLLLLKKLDAVRETSVFGIVVFDEAHHLRNPETDSNELGHTLSSLTEMMLMLSATPLNLTNDDLYNQMSILNSKSGHSP